MAERVDVSRSAAVGAVAGALSGLFGVGGGILIVPALVMALGFDQRRAHGTSLTAIVPIAAAGVTGYALAGEVDWSVAALLATGAVIGAPIGTAALRRLPASTLRTGFAVLLLITAARMIVDTPDAGGRSDLSLQLGGGLGGTGLAAGVLAGLMGVGGGIIMVPAQLLFFSIPDAVAKGTSLAVIIPTAVVGTARNVGHGSTDLRTGLIVGLSGTVSAFALAKVSIGLDPTVSSASFAALLTATSVRMLLRARRDRQRAESPVADASPMTSG